MRDYPKRISGRRREPRRSKPLDSARLEELALAYVARFATSAAKLEKYLTRKLRERGFVANSAENWLPDENEVDDDGDLAREAGLTKIEEIVMRFVERGYVDDDLYAKTRAGSLLNRGYGARRIEATLRQDGIADELREANAPGRGEARKAAVALARKRRFGPFASQHVGNDVIPEERDFLSSQEFRKLRDKQLAAMVRAGHDFADANAVLDARTIAEVEEWAAGDTYD